MKLSIIIVNYNVKYFLEQCLHSVLRAADGIEAEVLVVDNDSADSSVAFLQPLFPSVQFISSKRNLGFGKANNLALAKATGEFVLFLNPDTIVPEDCFTKCISFFETHTTAGGLGIRMLDGAGKFLPESKRSFPSASTAFFKAVGLSELLPSSNVFNKYSLGYLDERKNHQVDVLAGAFMMIRKKVLDQIGGFDEQFFMYGEDIDLSYRIRQAGFENWYVADTCIIHFKGESMKKWSTDHVRVFYEAMIVFVKKHCKGKGAGLLKVLLIAGIRLKSLASLIKGATTAANKKEHSSSGILVIGSKTGLEECKKIYQEYKREHHIITHLEIKNINLYPGEIKKHGITELLFCFPDISYAAALAIIDQQQSSISYRFHATSSNSIIGSDKKSELGEVLSIN